MAEDDGRIPQGMALPRLSPDTVLEVRPPSPVPEASESGLIPKQRRWLRGPVVAAALAAVAVVVGVGLVVPGMTGGSKTEGLPAPGQTTAAAVTQTASPTPSPTSKPSKTSKPKHTKSVTKTVAPALGKATKTTSTTKAPKQDWGTTVVPANTALKVGENWHTNRIKLRLTTAGDAVLTNENGKVTWSAGKSGGTALAFQGDGNLVLYQGNTVLWATGTAGHEGAKLVLQDDGNVTISQDSKLLWGAY